MNKALIGLDISISSTGLCIDIDGFKRLILIVDKTLTQNSKCDDVEYFVYNRISEKIKGYEGLDDEMLKLVSYENKANLVLEKIVETLKLYRIDTNDVEIYFEKPSLQAQGQAKLEIPIVNALVRRKLLTIFDINQINGHAPTQLKKMWTGNGRAKKEEMEEVYLTKDLPKLTRKIKGCKLDDIIDAIALVEIHK